MKLAWEACHVSIMCTTATAASVACLISGGDQTLSLKDQPSSLKVYIYMYVYMFQVPPEAAHFSSDKSLPWGCYVALLCFFWMTLLAFFNLIKRDINKMKSDTQRKAMGIYMKSLEENADSSPALSISVSAVLVIAALGMTLL